MTTAIQRAPVRPLIPVRAESVKAEPKDFGRLGSLGQASNHGWSMIRAYYFDISTFDLPLTEAEFLSLFGQEINLFSCGRQTATCGQRTNASCSATVTEPFLAVSFGIVALSDFEKFTINGVIHAPNAEAGPVPDVQLAQYRGVEGESYAGAALLATGQTAATLSWAWGAHRFIEKFFDAFRLQMFVNRRFMTLDENLYDIGMAIKPPSQDGASSSRIATMPFIRAVNDVMAAKGIDARFYPANWVVTCADATTCVATASACVPPPLAGVTYSTPHLSNLAGRLHCFVTPYLFLPGMDMNIKFVPTESESCFRALRDSVVYDCITPDANVEQGADGEIAGHCAASCNVPGGSISIGGVLGGYSVSSQCCIEYLSKQLDIPVNPVASGFGPGMVTGSPLASLYANNPTAMAYLSSITREARYLGKAPNGDTIDLGARVMGILNGVPRQQ